MTKPTDDSGDVPEQANPASTPKPPKKASSWPGVLALLLSLVALGVAAFSGWELNKLRNLPGELTSANSSYDNLNDDVEQLRRAQSNQAEALDDLEELLKESVAGIRDVPLRIEQVETLVKSVPGIEPRRRSDWLSAEALYYLKLANAQAVLTGNAAVAASALELADEKLLEAGDPRMTAVRAKLSDEITALRAMPTVDREGISFRLQSLTSQVTDWPFRETAPTNFRPEVAAPSDEQSAWERFTATLKSVFSSIILVKKTEGLPDVAQLGVNERALIVENLKAELQIARLAFLANNETLFKQSIEHSANQIGLYFDVEAEGVDAGLTLLGGLGETAFPGSVPDISGSLALFLAVGEGQ
jgi:uroporphyrin-3 C-methyltransferase